MIESNKIHLGPSLIYSRCFSTMENACINTNIDYIIGKKRWPELLSFFFLRTLNDVTQIKVIGPIGGRTRVLLKIKMRKEKSCRHSLGRFLWILSRPQRRKKKLSYCIIDLPLYSNSRWRRCDGICMKLMFIFKTTSGKGSAINRHNFLTQVNGMLEIHIHADLTMQIYHRMDGIDIQIRYGAWESIV